MKNTITKQHRWIPPLRALRTGQLLYIPILAGLLMTSCDDFVEVGLPKDQLIAEEVFKDAATVTDALRNSYSNMNNGDGMVSSFFDRNLGLYADELDSFKDEDLFYDHALSELSSIVKSWWTVAYKGVFAANNIVEGVQNSTALSQEDKNQLKGEALFIRAYLHSLLVNVYGPVPYISTTDFKINSKVSRMPVDVVYDHIITDLTAASELLDEDISGERVRPYKAVVEALLARVYLYTQQWDLAEAMASKVIDKTLLEPDLNKVFLKNASGSIWQLKPDSDGQNTQDAKNSILYSQPTAVALSEDALIAAFEPGDQRKVNWVGSVTGTDTWYYAFKYKEDLDTGGTSLEYRILFRLAEQYLIRAEARARAQQVDIPGAQSDLNIIRNRAGLPDTTAGTGDELQEAILRERRVELFGERGHRWFDLKRTGKASEVLAPIKPGWRDTDVLLPVSEAEILLNPNLLPQNDGYN